MLRQRLVSAFILIPIVLLGIWLLPLRSFVLLTALFFLVAVWEWSLFLSIQHMAARTLYLVIWLGAVGILYWVEPFTRTQLLIASGVWWLLAVVLIGMYPFSSYIQMLIRPLYGLFGILIFSFCWAGFYDLKQRHFSYVMYILVLTWVVDSSAYFVGRRWGRHAFFSKVSPKKTLEGLLGGFVGAVGCITAFGWIFSPNWEQWLKFATISIVAAIFAVVGDLFESLMKRETGVKDTGTMIPGHGGLLDRIDSMLAAVPIFALGVHQWL